MGQCHKPQLSMSPSPNINFGRLSSLFRNDGPVTSFRKCFQAPYQSSSIATTPCRASSNPLQTLRLLSRRRPRIRVDVPQQGCSCKTFWAGSAGQLGYPNCSLAPNKRRSLEASAQGKDRQINCTNGPSPRTMSGRPLSSSSISQYL